jgi:hypothetical protein
MMRNGSLALLFCLSLVGAAGCAAQAGDDSASSDQALTEYEGVAKNGTKVTSSTTPTETQSAKTRLVGFIKNTQLDAVANELLRIDHWKTIKDKDGNKPFDASSLKGDSTSNGVRTVTGKVTINGGIDLDLRATSRGDETKTTLHFTNTTGYKHWLAGQILDPGKLTIDVTLVPLQDGVIVDATMKVKLDQMEDKAAGFCAALPLVFDWLDGKTGDS